MRFGGLAFGGNDLAQWLGIFGFFRDFLDSVLDGNVGLGMLRERGSLR